ncbi:MAG TPA: hypothetical protein VGL91_12610 [Acidobacteriota bacterium]
MLRRAVSFLPFYLLVLILRMLEVRADSVLNFPRLSFESNTFTGIAIVNPSPQAALVTLTAYGTDGRPVSASGFKNPAQLTVPANQQVAKLTSEVFGGTLPSTTIGWFQAISTNDGLTGFFLYLDGSDTFFDGADLPPSAAKIVFNQMRLDSGYATELDLLNPGDIAANVQLQLFGSGSSPVSKSVSIPGKGIMRMDAAAFFGVTTVSAGGYVVATGDTNIAGFEFVKSPGGDLLGLNARAATEQLANLFFPQMAVLGPWKTDLGLVNYSTSPVIVTISAYKPDGTLYATGNVQNNPVTRSLAAGVGLREDVAAMFGFSGASAQDGWIKVESTSAAVNGYVSYGAGRSVAAVASASQGLTRAIFSHIATSSGFFNGVAVLNPGSMAVNVRILAIQPGGQVLGSFDTVLAPGQRLSKQINEVIPQASGQAGGIIWIKSDRPVYLTELFGTNNTLANVPAQPAPDSYAPDSALPLLKIVPALAPVQVASSQTFQVQNGSGNFNWKVNGTPGGNPTLGTISSSGLYSAPSVVPVPQSLTITAETTTQIAGASVDVLRKDVLVGGLGQVKSVAYLGSLKKLYDAELSVLSASQPAATTTTSGIFEVSPSGAKTLVASFSNELIPKMIPFTASNGTEYLLLAAQTSGRVVRLNPVTQQSVNVATGLNQPAALVIDPISGDLLVAEADQISVVDKDTLEGPGVTKNTQRSPRVWPRAQMKSNSDAPSAVTLLPLGATGVADDACTGDIYFSDARAGAIVKRIRLTGQVVTIVSGLKNPGQLLAFYRSGVSCPGSLQLLVVEQGADRISLVIPTDASLTPWIIAPGTNDVIFLPKGTSFAPNEGVLFPQISGTTGQIALTPTPALYQSQPINPPVIPPVSDVVDPTGDTFGTGQVQIDITFFSAHVEGSDLVLRVNFAGPVTPGDSGQPNAVVGYIDLDVDQNAATGTESHVDVFSPFKAKLGIEYSVFLFNYSSATKDTPLIDTNFNTLGRVPVTFTSNSLTVRVPLSLIKDDGIVNTAIVLGTVPEPTDIAPNGGFITSSPAVARGKQ